MKKIVIATVLVLVTSITFGAAQKITQNNGVVNSVKEALGAKPVLQQVQRLELQIALKNLENAQLRLNIAQQDVQRAKLAAQSVLRDLDKPGWVISTQTWDYVEAPKEEQKK